MSATARGMTLIEALVSVGLLGLVLLGASALVGNSARVIGNAQRSGDTQDGARLAGEALLRDVRRAGLGARLGVSVSDGRGAGGSGETVSPIWGSDDGGTDDLWLVVPDKNAFGETCCPGCASPAPGDPGASTSVVVSVDAGSGAPGPLSVQCVSTLASAHTLMVTDMSRGALLTGASVTAGSPGSPASIAYNEQSVPNFPWHPVSAGDQVFPVTLWHYYVDANGPGGRPALYKSAGTVTGNPSAPAFQDVPGTAVLVQANVEDLQIKYGRDPLGTANPDAYQYQDGFPASLSGPLDLRALRVTVVAVSASTMKDSLERAMDGGYSPYAPIAVENHAPAADAGDGYQRVVYSRRVELTNLMPGNL